MADAPIPRPLSSQRAGLGAVVAMHVVLALLLMRDIPRTIVAKFTPPLDVHVLDDAQAPEVPLPELPKPKALTPPLSRPLPVEPGTDVADPSTISAAPAGLHREEAPVDPTPGASGASPAGDGTEMHTPLLPPAGPPRITARPATFSAQACAPRGDDYPPAARRVQASGTTRLRVTFGATGNLVLAEIIQSAGATHEHRLLDKVAKEKLAGCTFKAGTDQNGQAVGGTFEVEYVWRLEN